MILKLDIDTMRVSELITIDDMIRQLYKTEEDSAIDIEKTIMTLGLAIASQADHYCRTVDQKQLFILSVTHIANKIVTEEGSYFSTREDDEYDDEDDE